MILLAELEYLDASSDWVLNIDDSVTALSDAVLSVSPVSGTGSASVATASSEFTFGQLLGDSEAATPLVLTASGVGDVLAVEVDLAEGSDLDFLTGLPGQHVFRRRVTGESSVASARLGRRILSVEDE